MGIMVALVGIWAIWVGHPAVALLGVIVLAIKHRSEL